MHAFQFTFDAIGTRWVIDGSSSGTVSDQLLLEKIQRRIAAFDKTYSRFRSDSLITQMSRKQGTYTLPDDADALVTLYHTVYQATNGAFTPLIGRVMSDAGYDANYSLQPRRLKHPPPWEEVISYTHPTVTMKKPALLDFGAAGKGQLIDLVGEVLHKEGMTSFCIDAGGDILQNDANKKFLRVGLEHPENLKQVIGVAQIVNQSICSSAGNRRNWGTYHHLIDPTTLTSPSNILASWTVAKTALIADALATALFLTSPENLTSLFDFEYLLVYPDYTIKKSSHFPAELFYG